MQSPILTLCATLVVTAAQALPSAPVVDLGPTSLFSTEAPQDFFPGGSGVLNGHGHVAGVAYDPVLGPVAAIDAFGTVTTLGSTAILESYGTAINDAESVVGYFSSAVDATHAGLFRRGRATVDLGSLGGPISAAFAINNDGVIVGYSYLADGSTAHAASFSTVHGPIDLGSLGGTFSAALAVNRFNRAVGFSLLSDDATFHATLFSSYAPAFDLGSLGGPLSVATAINGRGEIVGSSLLSDGVTTHAAAFTPGGAPTDLGALAGDTTSLANGINSASCIVGTSSSLVQRGVLWTKSRGVWTIVDLNGLIQTTGGWTIDSAIAINNQAIVVATGFKSDGVEHTVLINLGGSLNSRCVAFDE